MSAPAAVTNHWGRIFAIAVHLIAVEAVEIREQRIEVLLRKRIVFVIVAASAADRQPQHHGPERFDSVDNCGDVDFFRDNAAFVGRNVTAIEAGGDQLFVGRVSGASRQRVVQQGNRRTEVAVEGPDDPVAVGPHLAVVIEMEAMRIAVTGGVEPVAGHVLTVARRRRATDRRPARKHRVDCRQGSRRPPLASAASR